jgi:signal transduction histidine kinase
MFRSIRHGLFAALAGFTVLICVCYTGLILVIAYVTEDMLIDRLLQREADTVIAHARQHGTAGQPSNEMIRAYASVAALPPPVREAVRSGRRRAEIFTDTGRHYHLRTIVLAAGSGTHSLYLVADVTPLLVVSKLVREVGGVLAAVALGLIGLALLLAYLLSRRLVAPLQQLASEVRDIRPGAPIELGARQRRDEIGYLADRLGSTIAELHAALAREQAFTRDVSHELRTPLTVMKNTFVQLGAQPPGERDVAQLRAGVDAMADTVDVLFALARAEHIADQTFDLRGCIEECLLRLVDDDWTGERLLLDLPDRLEVTGNRHLSTLLMNNCLGNALFHGGPASRLELTFAQGRLTLKNSVDPCAGGAMQGFLHGQNLLLRIAAAMDWDVCLHAGVRDYRVEIVPRRDC